jgi:hypothetical protein
LFTRIISDLSTDGENLPMTLEEKIIEYKELQAQIKVLEEKKAESYKEILASFPKNSQEINSENFRVKRYTKFTIRTTLEEARAFQATKVEESVDKERIKELIHTGICIPHVTETSYFFIYNQVSLGSPIEEEA